MGANAGSNLLVAVVPVLDLGKCVVFQALQRRLRDDGSYCGGGTLCRISVDGCTAQYDRAEIFVRFRHEGICPDRRTVKTEQPDRLGI